MKTTPTLIRQQRQAGAVLITGLIFMTLVMLIALSVMRSATLEERMAANSRNRQLALEAAEAVVRDAELSLFAAAPFNPFDLEAFVASCTGGYCAAPAAGDTPRWQSASTWSNTANTRTFANATSNLTASLVASQPSYIVELIGQEGGQTQHICPKLLFRITARGVGVDGSEVFVEDIYRHRPATFSDGSCG